MFVMAYIQVPNLNEEINTILINYSRSMLEYSRRFVTKHSVSVI